MATETKNIIQLKESTNGPTFYPESHKSAIVGKETYSYLGEVVSPGGGGGGSTGGEKALSISPRQSIVVGKCIPVHPRKGKKYYFADGLIKVNRGQDIAFYSYDPDSDQHIAFESSSQKLPVEMGLLYHSGIPVNLPPVIVEITREWIFDTFDLNECTIRCVGDWYSSDTESPNLKVINGHIRNTSTPELVGRSNPANGVTSGLLYEIDSLLYFDRLRGYMYKTIYDSNYGPYGGQKSFRCWVKFPKWIQAKLNRYQSNGWTHQVTGNDIPRTVRTEGGPGISKYMRTSGRVYLFSVRRRRVGDSPRVLHFRYKRHGAYCSFSREKMILH